MKQGRGFTLVELLVVIGIIGVLIGITLPSMRSAVRASRAVVCQSNLRQIGAGLLMYANENRQHLPYVIEPIWQSNGLTNFNADPAAEPLSLQNVMKTYLKDTKVYICPNSALGYPKLEPKMSYRVSSANNFDGQPKTIDQLMTPAGPKYEYSLKYLNGRLYRQQYIESSSYPFRLVNGVGPFYVIRDFVNQTGGGEFAPPHPPKLYNQLKLDMSVTSEKDPHFGFTFP